MNKTIITKYTAYDGTEFSNMEDCSEYELNLLRHGMPDMEHVIFDKAIEQSLLGITPDSKAAEVSYYWFKPLTERAVTALILAFQLKGTEWEDYILPGEWVAIGVTFDENTKEPTVVDILEEYVFCDWIKECYKYLGIDVTFAHKKVEDAHETN